VQSTGTPVHGSGFIPQSLGPQVAGVQHWPLAALQWVLVPSLAQVFPVQSTGTPVHGSGFIPQSPGPQVAGVQHWPVVALQWVLVPSLAQVFPVQSTGTPVHGSGFIPQSFGPHVTGAQHAPPMPQVSVAVVQLHVTELPHESVFVPHTFPLHGETQVHLLFTHSCPCPPSVLQFVVPQLTVSPHEFFSVPHFPSHAGGSGAAGHFVHPVSTPPHPLPTTAPPPGSHTPGLAQVSGVQQEPVRALHDVPTPHVVGDGHVMVVPHPEIDDTHLPVQSAAVGGTHATHLLSVHTSVPGQVGQTTATPHESVTTPHWAPCAAHAGFAETHSCVLSLQTSFAGQAAGFPASLQWNDGLPQFSNAPQAPAPRMAQMFSTHASGPNPPSSWKGSASPASAPASPTGPPSPLPEEPSSPRLPDPSSPSVASSPLSLPSWSSPGGRFDPSLPVVASVAPPPSSVPPPAAPSEPPHAMGVSATSGSNRVPTSDQAPRDPSERTDVYFSTMVKMLGEFRAREERDGAFLGAGQRGQRAVRCQSHPMAESFVAANLRSCVAVRACGLSTPRGDARARCFP
jgi:hypothetical protein